MEASFDPYAQGKGSVEEGFDLAFIEEFQLLPCAFDPGFTGPIEVVVAVAQGVRSPRRKASIVVRRASFFRFESPSIC